MQLIDQMDRQTLQLSRLHWKRVRPLFTFGLALYEWLRLQGVRSTITLWIQASPFLSAVKRLLKCYYCECAAIGEGLHQLHPPDEIRENSLARSLRYPKAKYPLDS